MSFLLSIVLATATPYTPGALAVAGSVELSGNTRVDGNSMAPGMATNCPNGRMAGVTVRDTTNMPDGSLVSNSVTIAGSAAVLGSPSIQVVDENTFNNQYLMTPEQLDTLRSYAVAHGTYIMPSSEAQFTLAVTDGLIFIDTVNGARLTDPVD